MAVSALATAFRIISIRLCVPTTVSLPASPAPRSWPFCAPKIVGEFRIIPPFIAFLYQSTEIIGIDTMPPMLCQYQEKCGIFSLGKLHVKLNRPLIRSMALLIRDFALSIGEVIAVLMLFQTEDAVVLMELKALDTEVFTLFTALETEVLMLFHTLLIEVLIPLMVVDTEVLIEFHVVETVVLMPFTTFETVVLIEFQTVLTVVEMPFTTVVTVVLMEFQTVEMVV